MDEPINFAALFEPVALELLGDPNSKGGNRWRWGSKGSLSADVDAGTWYDHESSEGGGVLALIERETGITGSAGQIGWLADRGLVEARDTRKSVIDPAQIERQRQQRAEEQSQRQAEREADKVGEQAQAAERAMWLWGSYKQADPSHPYLALKGIDPAGHSLRQHQSGKTLVVPMFAAGELVNLQFISDDGDKRFLKDGQTNGCYTLIGKDSGQGRAFCEGYADGYTVWKASGQQAVVVFSAGNLAHVVESMGRPGDVVAADNDNAVKLGHGFGKRLDSYGTGHKVAMMAGLPFYLPDVPGKDFNDLGTDSTRAIFDAEPVSNVPIFNAWKLAPVELPKAQPAELVGLMAGITDPAQAAAMAYSIAARLAPRAPAQMSLANIREAIEASAEPNALHPVTLDNIAQRLDKAQAHRQRRALEPVNLPADIRARHQYQRMTAIPEIGSDEWQGVIVVKAPMGAGKTQNVGRPLAEAAHAAGKTTLAICHRVSLVTELANRLSLTHYNKTQGGTSGVTRGLATCLPSITKPGHADLIDRSRVVFIDEIAQVLRFIESEKACRTNDANNQGVYERLQQIVANADCVVVADAGADSRTIEFLESCRPGERFRVIEVVPSAKPDITGSYNYGADAVTHAVREALAELAADGKPWLAVESIDRAKALEHFFKTAMPDKSILAVHGENKDNKRQRDFLSNADQASRDYDLVIASPVIGSGLSIEHKPKVEEKDGEKVSVSVPESEKFTLGVYIGGGHRTTPADAAQQMRRVRYIDRFQIALVANSSAVGSQSPEAAIAAAVTASKIEGKAAPVTSFDQLIASIRTDAENARADFAAGLLWQLQASGWNLERQQAKGSKAALTHGQVSERVKEARDHIREAKLEALINAPAITDIRADLLEQQQPKSELTIITLEAHRIRRALGIRGEPLTEDILSLWDDGRVVAKLDRFSAQQGIVSAFDDSERAVSSRRYYQACARAYGWLFDGIDTTAEDWLTPDVAEIMLDRMIGQRHLLSHLGIVGKKYGMWIADKANKGQPKPMKRPLYPVREVVAMIERMGLKMRSKKKRMAASGCGTSLHKPIGDNAQCATPQGKAGTAKKHTGNPMIRVYQATAGSMIEMEKWADSRNAGRQVEAVDTTPREATTGRAVLVAEMRETVKPLHRAVRRATGDAQGQRTMRLRRVATVAAQPTTAMPAPAPQARQAEPAPLVAYQDIAPLPNHGAPELVGTWPDDLEPMR